MSEAATARETEAKRAERIRLKQMTSIMTNIGYGILAAAVIQPISSEGEVAGKSMFGFALGLFCLALAVYIAPLGEPK